MKKHSSSVDPMKASLFVIGLLVMIVLSCQVLRDRKPQVLPQDERLKIVARFSHTDHEKFLKNNEFTCVTCHRIAMNDDPQTGKTAVGQKAVNTDGPGLVEVDLSLGQCHACHTSGLLPEAPEKCKTCHSELDLIKPDFHRGYFERRHGYLAKTDLKTCNRCHEERFCSECHIQRNRIDERMHDRTFLYYHSTEARVSPHRCDSCHQQRFCFDCHKNEPALK